MAYRPHMSICLCQIAPCQVTSWPATATFKSTLTTSRENCRRSQPGEQKPPMTVLAAPPPAPGRAIDPARLIEANINPVTGLATDYLNHFNEAIMMMELAPQMLDCMEDLRAWRPLSYCEHFSASKFKERELAIAAYERADPALRRSLDDL